MTSIEWPKGSGEVATYAPHERTLIRAILAQGSKPNADHKAIAREVEVLHQLKVAFGGEFLP